MKLFSSYTDSHIELMDRFFLPSIPSGLELETLHITKVFGGTLVSGYWRQIALERCQWLAEKIAAQPVNDIILFTDVDVQWFDKDFVAKIPGLLGDCDAAYQLEIDQEACCGFHIIRCNTITTNFYQLLHTTLRIKDVGGLQDQKVLNQLLGDKLINYKLLPPNVVWTTRRKGHRIYKSGVDTLVASGEAGSFIVPPDILVHHGNWNNNLNTKIEVMQKVKDIVSRYQRVLTHLS